MPTECSADLFEFASVEGRKVVAAFDAGPVTSDAGALLLGATDRAIGMMTRFASCPLRLETGAAPSRSRAGRKQTDQILNGFARDAREQFGISPGGPSHQKVRKRRIPASSLSSPTCPVAQEARHLGIEIEARLPIAWQRHDLKVLRIRHDTVAALAEA